MNHSTATVQCARFAPTSYCIERMNAALRTYRSPRSSGSGQLSQPGRHESTTNFQHALFARVKVCQLLILREGAQCIDHVGGGCEHGLAEGSDITASVRAA